MEQPEVLVVHSVTAHIRDQFLRWLMAQAKKYIDRNWERLMDVQKHFEPRQTDTLPLSSTD